MCRFQKNFNNIHTYNIEINYIHIVPIYIDNYNIIYILFFKEVVILSCIF